MYNLVAILLKNEFSNLNKQVVIKSAQYILQEAIVPCKSAIQGELEKVLEELEWPKVSIIKKSRQELSSMIVLSEVLYLSLIHI